MGLKQFFESSVTKIRLLGRVFGAKKSNKQHFKALKQHNIPIKKLTRSQKREIDAIFKIKRGKRRYKYSYATHQLYLSVTGKFDARIIPEDLFRIYIEPQMNEITHRKVFANKAYFDKMLPSANLPKTVVRNFGGIFFDSNYNFITYEQATEIVNGYSELVYKKAIETGSGRGVHLVDLKNENPLVESNKNYLLQEKIIQHPDLSKLNESSVNIVRVMTWFNGKEVVALSLALRVGGKGFFTDNSTTSDGMGMTVTGLTNDGVCSDLSFYSCGIKAKVSASGVELNSYKIPQVDKMIEEAKKQHLQLLPNIDFVGWDFTVDDKNNVIIIEYNITCPGILYYQYVNGPLFADKTDEFLNRYLGKKK